MVDLKDPIQVHLLTETALSDSKKYEILSQEEVDDLKKQVQLMTQRVDSTRANLAIQAKFRDAALSMAKLDGSGRTQDMDAAEREEVERKCEELALELFSLEKKLLVPQRRLLEHTAGILQLTHKASKRKAAAQNNLVNGIPGSPESLYTYSHSRNSLDAAADDNYFDETYGLDGMDGGGRRKNAIEIPMKSPVREQLREENASLVKSVSEMEQKLRSLNGSLRETIVRFNPGVNNDYLEPPTKAPNSKPGDMLRSQIDYLESGLVAVQAEQESFAGNTPRSIGGDGDGSEAHIAAQDLFRIIQTGFEGTKQRREERRRARTDKGLEDDEDDEEDEFDHGEEYSLGGFKSRVQWLSSQASTLKEQQSVLKRQIKQQRELNNKSDAEKDEELARRQEEIENGRQLVMRAEQDSMDAQKMLSEALQELETARAAAVSGNSVQADLQDREETIELLEKKIKKIEAEGKKANDLTSQLEEVSQKHAAAAEELQTHKTNLAAKDKEIKKHIDEIDDLNMTLAELKTEVTIARAELDGAYGSRAERAADVAALKNNAEVQKLSNQIEKLKKELTGTVQDLENVTKETLSAEREKVELEGKLDEALQAKVKMDAEVQKVHEQMAKLQDDLDGERLKGGGKSGAGASMLSEQFRATMREERKKFQEDLRVRLFRRNALRWAHFYCIIWSHSLTQYLGGAFKDPQVGRGAQSAQAKPRAWQESIESAITTTCRAYSTLPRDQTFSIAFEF